MQRNYRRRITAAALFGIAAAVFPWTTDTLSGGVPATTDHFKCYVANELTLEPPFRVDLNDQFGPQDDVMVHNAGWFCNPTSKLVDEVVIPILEPNNHLTLYPISNKDPEPRRLVTVDNQFGEQELVLTAPRLVAVPTQKDDLPPFLDISHFLCYEARSPALHIDADVRDQFQLDDDVDVLSATFFCNPAAKTVGEDDDEITTDPEPGEAHLTCYKFAPSHNPEEPEFADISNQFDEEDTLRIGPSQYLCLPSDKLDVDSGGRGEPNTEELIEEDAIRVR